MMAILVTLAAVAVASLVLAVVVFAIESSSRPRYARAAGGGLGLSDSSAPRAELGQSPVVAAVPIATAPIGGPVDVLTLDGPQTLRDVVDARGARGAEVLA